MSDIKDPRLLWAKGLLFVGLAALAGWMIWIKVPSWETVLVLGVFAWACSRAYYFAFYVIEKYADPSFRYSGLLSLLSYVKAKALGQSYLASIASTETQSNDVKTVKFQLNPADLRRRIYYEAVWWSIFFAIANLITPSIYSNWFSSWSRVNSTFQYVPQLVFMGLYCSQIAVASCFCAILPKPVKWTLPGLLLLVLMCSITVSLGVSIADGLGDLETFVVTIIGGSLGSLSVLEVAGLDVGDFDFTVKFHWHGVSLLASPLGTVRSASSTC